MNAKEAREISMRNAPKSPVYGAIQYIEAHINAAIGDGKLELTYWFSGCGHALDDDEKQQLASHFINKGYKATIVPRMEDGPAHIQGESLVIKW